MNRARVPLEAALDSPAAKRLYVRRLFATIAGRYDLITVLLSFGLDRRWKERLTRLAGELPNKRVLDLATGTGDIAFELARRGARVVGLDITHRMVQIAAAKPRRIPRPASPTPHPSFLVSDMMALPFAAGAFDVITTGYGLRNVPHLEGAVAEIERVLRPGGLLLSLDFNRPSSALVRSVYLAYLTVVGSALGYLLHRDPDTYRYIPQSIRRYPGAPAVARMLTERGFSSARWIPVLGGLMAIHIATRAERLESE